VRLRLSAIRRQARNLEAVQLIFVGLRFTA
jgi:hypothetical protein